MQIPLAGRHDHLWSRLAGEKGSATVEFALLLPFALTVLGLSLAAIVLATNQVTLSAAAHDVARMIARSESGGAVQQRLVAAGDAITLTRTISDDLCCVRLSHDVGHGALAGFGIRLEAEGCALISV